MNGKRYLEASIHGWFPEQPYLVKTGVKEEFETKRQPSAIPIGYDLRATKVAELTAILWFILGSLLIVLFFGIGQNISLSFQIAWIIVGLTVGLFSGAIVMTSQLRRLSKNCQLKTSKKDLSTLVIPLCLIFFFGQFISINYVGLRSSALLGDLSAIFAFAIIVQVIRYGLFATYEKRKKILLMQKLGEGIIVISRDM